MENYKDEKDFLKKVNIDKAYNNSVFILVITVLNIAGHIIVSKRNLISIIMCLTFLVLMILFRYHLFRYELGKSKVEFLVLYLILIANFLYDLVFYISHSLYEFGYWRRFYLWFFIFYANIFTILTTVFLNIRKANNPKKYRETTDWFYENYDDVKNRK